MWETKVCKICGKDKIDEPNYLINRSICKDCDILERKERYIRNKEKILERRKEYYKLNAEYIQNQHKGYNRKNKEYRKQRDKEYHFLHKKERNAATRLWSKKNKKIIAIKKRQYIKERMKTDIPYRLRMILRRRCVDAIKCRGGRKGYKMLELLGATPLDCRIWLESKFLPGMTWDNHGWGEGKWHIDHIMPCASFDLTNPDEQKKCFHYTNLQPLWHNDNIAKSDKIEVFTSEGIFWI